MYFCTNMKRYVITLIVCTFLASIQGKAEAYKVGDIVMVHLQDKTRYVCNPDYVLSSATVAKIDSILYALEQKTGIETLVVAVKEIEGGDCFNFAYELGKQNGVGKKNSNNGLVVLLATQDRCIQFVTGYGLEGILPDAICKRIQIKKMNPYFAKDEWNAGMLSGIQAINSYLNGSMEPENIENENSGELYILGFVFLFMLGIFALSYYIQRKKTRCPHCKKHTLHRTDSHLISRKNGIKRERVVYTCSNCGYTVVKDEDSDDQSGGIGRAGRGGPIIFGGGPFRGGGGGFSGGSFGGGSFGGGGAGSRF